LKNHKKNYPPTAFQINAETYVSTQTGDEKLALLQMKSTEWKFRVFYFQGNLQGISFFTIFLFFGYQKHKTDTNGLVTKRTITRTLWAT